MNDSLKEAWIGNKKGYEVYLVDHTRIQSLYGELHEDLGINETNIGIKNEYLKLSYLFDYWIQSILEKHF